MSKSGTKLNQQGSFLLSGTSWLIAAFVALPILVVCLSLFSNSNGAWQHLVETNLLLYVSNTLLLMALVGILSTIIGVGCAWLVTATRLPGAAFFSWALVIPLAAPAYIIAYAYTDLLDFAGIVQSSLRASFSWKAGDYWFPSIRSLPGAALMLSLVLYPYIYLFSRAAFSRRSNTLFEAARTLGASPLKAFRRIALPVARPAIIGGLALVLMETIADYGVVEYFGVPTFSTGIFRTWFSMGEKVAALKLAAVMFITVAVLIVIERQSRQGRVATNLAKDGNLAPYKLSPLHSLLAFLACLMPILLGAVIPVSFLLYLHFSEGDPKFGQDFIIFIQNSVSVALIAAFVAAALAIILSYAQRWRQKNNHSAALQISTLGYALPGVLIAIGLLSPLTSLDKAIAPILADLFNTRKGLFITGTIIALVYAYVIRFLTVAYNSCQSGFETIDRSIDEAAQTLGAKRAKIAARLHFPLLSGSVFSAICLVFVDVMRELPATLILRPFNFETLATRAYRLAADERIAEASTASLVIIFIGLIPVLIVHYFSRKK